MAETRARHATKEEERATEDKLLGIDRYRREEAEASIELALKRHAITQRDAEVQKAYLDNPLAQGDSPEAKRIKQEISALADAKQALRMAEITHVGMFSGAYSPGRVNFGALNQNRPYGALQGPGQFTDKYTAATNVTDLNKDFAAPLSKLFTQPLPVTLVGTGAGGASAGSAVGTASTPQPLTDHIQAVDKDSKKIKFNADQLAWLAQDKILNPKETHPKYDVSGNLISGTPLKYHTTHTVGGEGWVPTPMNELMDNARGGKKDSVDHDAAQTALLATIAAHMGIIVQNGGLN
jgi:hypothetical protein